MCLLTIEEQQYKEVYQEWNTKDEVTKQDLWTTAIQKNFTPRNAVKKLNELLVCKNIAVFFNPEVVKYLVDLGYPAEKITFFSDDEVKQELFLHDINCTVEKWNMENIMKYKKHFDGGSINPAFKLSKELRRQAESMVKGKLLVVTPNRDLEDEKYLQNICYFKNLSNTAFDEAIYTSLLIVDTENTPNTITVESTDGNNSTVVKNLKTYPQNDIENWLFAEKVFSLKLPGYNATNSGGINASTVKTSEDGIPTIFQIGYPDSTEFKLVKKVDNSLKDQLVGVGFHKLIVSRIANPYKRSVGKYAGPEYAVGESAMAVLFETKEEAMKAVNYYNSDKVLKLITGSASRKTNSKSFFSSIPHHMYSDQWDENL